MAELRLAMVGMGKAMSVYMTPLDNDVSSISEEQRRGLYRVKDALLDCAGRDVDSLVREWVWQEQTRPDEPEKADDEERPLPTSVPQDITPGRIAPSTSTPHNSGSGGNGASTPTTPHSSFPSSTFSAPTKPALHLSSRTGNGPITGLPRVPQSAPLGGSRYTSTRTTGNSNSSIGKVTDVPTRKPLAGQEEGSTQPPGRKGDDGFKRQVVFDPLGAGS